MNWLASLFNRYLRSAVPGRELVHNVVHSRITLWSMHLVVLCLIGLKFFTYWDLEWWYRELFWGDHMYYWSLGLSFHQNGIFENIIYEPAEPVLNAHIGIGYITYMLISMVGTEPLSYLSSAYLLGGVMLIFSYVAFHYIGKEFDLPAYVIPVLFLFFALQTYFFEVHTRGQTETYFYPAFLWWFVIVLKLLKNDHRTGLFVALVIVSAMAYSFRIQALIGFLAVLIYTLWQQNFRQTLRFLGAFSVAVLLVQLLNVWHTDVVGMGSGESGHMANILGMSWSRLTDFFGNRLGQTLIYESKPGWYIIHLLVLLYIIGLQLWGILKDRKQQLLVGLIVFGTLAAYLLFRDEERGAHVRYVLHVMPILLVATSSLVYKISSNKYVKMVMLSPVIIFVLLFVRYTANDYQNRNDAKYEHIEKHKSALERDLSILDKYSQPIFVAYSGYRTPYRYLFSISQRNLHKLENHQPKEGDLIYLPAKYINDGEFDSFALEQITEVGRLQEGAGYYALYQISNKK